MADTSAAQAITGQGVAAKAIEVGVRSRVIHHALGEQIRV